jgi:hypothetical protein
MQLPLNVSPVSASFFGFKRLGIHLVLFLACSLLSALFLCFNSCCYLLTAKLKKSSIQLVRCTVGCFGDLLKEVPYGIISDALTPTAGEWKPVGHWKRHFTSARFLF